MTDPYLPQEEEEELPEMSPGDRRAYVLGAMTAALAIGMVFLAVGAIVIFLMTLVW